MFVRSSPIATAVADSLVALGPLGPSLKAVFFAGHALGDDLGTIGRVSVDHDIEARRWCCRRRALLCQSHHLAPLSLLLSQDGAQCLQQDVGFGLLCRQHRRRWRRWKHGRQPGTGGWRRNCHMRCTWTRCCSVSKFRSRRALGWHIRNVIAMPPSFTWAALSTNSRS